MVCGLSRNHIGAHIRPEQVLNCTKILIIMLKFQLLNNLDFTLLYMLIFMNELFWINACILTYSDVFSVPGVEGCTVENVKAQLGDVFKHIKVKTNKIFMKNCKKITHLNWHIKLIMETF